MTEYKDNEAYERDKAELIRFAEDSILMLISNKENIANLLRQSKWVGNADSKSVRPLPVVKDGNGKLIKDYTRSDWFTKLNEKLDEFKVRIIEEECGYSDSPYFLHKEAAEELQDLITVATSMQAWLDFDESARDKLADKVNEKNRSRGYLDQANKLSEVPVKNVDACTPKKMLEVPDKLIDDCIHQLKSLIEDRQSFFNADGDDDIFREDAEQLQFAIDLIKKAYK